MKTLVRQPTRLICLLLITILFSVRGKLFLAQGWANSGLISFNQYLAAPTPPLITVAESFFLHAIGFPPSDNQTAWRGVGWAYSVRGLESEAIDAWLHTDNMFAETLLWGQLAQNRQEYDKALIWYARASALNAASSKSWYGSGLVYEEMQAWESAVAAYEQGLLLAPNDVIGKSDLSFRIGRILSRELVPPDLPKAAGYFSAAIASDDFRKPAHRVEAYFLNADAARLLGNDSQAIVGYERVLALDPGNYWAHAYLGMLYWQVQREFSLAELHLLTALARFPEQKWAYEQLLVVYEQSDNLLKAAALREKMSVVFP